MYHYLYSTRRDGLRVENIKLAVKKAEEFIAKSKLHFRAIELYPYKTHHSTSRLLRKVSVELTHSLGEMRQK